jgi:carboxypeptidase D
MGNYGASIEYSTLSIMQTYPQLFGFDTSTYEYFVEQYNLCGYNVTLNYPASSDYPTLRASGTLSPSSGKYRSKNFDAIAHMNTVLSLYKLKPEDTIDSTAVVDGKMFVKRQQDDPTTPPRFVPTGFIDPWYGCWIMEHLTDYATNYTAPWRESSPPNILCYVMTLVLM